MRKQTKASVSPPAALETRRQSLQARTSLKLQTPLAASKQCCRHTSPFAALANARIHIRATHPALRRLSKGWRRRRARAHACAAALAAAKGKAAPKIARWRLDVDDGRLCPKGWSAEASSLVEDALREFDAATRAHWQSDDRVKSRAALAAYLQSEVGSPASAPAARGCGKETLAPAERRLGRVYAKAGSADADAFDAELRKAEHDFDGDAARCRVDALKLDER